MTQQQESQSPRDEGQSSSIEHRGANREVDVQQDQTSDDTTNPDMPPTNDAGDGISEGELYDASGAATGGGVDTPTAVDKSSVPASEQKKHIHQGL